MQFRLLFVTVNLEWVHTYSDPELQLFPKLRYIQLPDSPFPATFYR